MNLMLIRPCGASSPYSHSIAEKILPDRPHSSSGQIAPDTKKKKNRQQYLRQIKIRIRYFPRTNPMSILPNLKNKQQRCRQKNCRIRSHGSGQVAMSQCQRHMCDAASGAKISCQQTERAWQAHSRRQTESKIDQTCQKQNGPSPHHVIPACSLSGHPIRILHACSVPNAFRRSFADRHHKHRYHSVHPVSAPR